VADDASWKHLSGVYKGAKKRQPLVDFCKAIFFENLLA
jgi:hypothetical protein